jgi:hypothetical protein
MSVMSTVVNKTATPAISTTPGQAVLKFEQVDLRPYNLSTLLGSGKPMKGSGSPVIRESPASSGPTTTTWGGGSQNP